MIPTPSYLQSVAMTVFINNPEIINNPLQVLAAMRKIVPDGDKMELKMAYGEALVEYRSCLLRDASRNYAEAMNYLDKIHVDMDNRHNSAYVRKPDSSIRTFGRE